MGKIEENFLFLTKMYCQNSNYAFEILKLFPPLNSRWKLYPRMLRNVAEVDLSTLVLGQRVSMPICAGATAMQCMAHVDGELATVRGRKKVLTQRVRRGLTFSDSLLCVHHADTSLDVFTASGIKPFDSAIQRPGLAHSATLFSNSMALVLSGIE